MPFILGFLFGRVFARAIGAGVAGAITVAMLHLSFNTLWFPVSFGYWLLFVLVGRRISAADAKAQEEARDARLRRDVEVMEEHRAKLETGKRATVRGRAGA